MTRTQLMAMMEYIDARIVEIVHAHETQTADRQKERTDRTKKARDGLHYEFLNDWSDTNDE